MISLSKVFNPLGKAGTMDPVTGEMHTTPWVARTDDGIYIGLNNEVWLYWVLPSVPFRFEDPGEQLAIGGPLHEILMDIGATSRRPVAGLGVTGEFRDVHLVAIQWEEQPTPPKGSTDRLAAHLQETFTFLGGRKACFLGVKLRRGGTAAAMGGDGVFKMLQRLAKQSMQAGYPELQNYRRDRERMQAILARHQARRPTLRESRMLESWYNMGNGTDSVLIAEPNGRKLSSTSWDHTEWADGIEMGAVVEFDRLILNSPRDAWAADAFSHADGPIIMSIRGELMPAETARTKFRGAQRKALAQAEEQAKTGDLARKEDSDALSLGKSIEDYFADGAEPMFTDASIVFGRIATPTEDTYRDLLRSRYGIIAKPLEQRQIEALDETLPCSTKRLGRIKPFGQALSVPMIAYSGMSSFSQLGDDKGLFLGLALPDYSPVYVDPEGSAERDMPPGMAVVGEPGSGKTFAGLSLAYQAVLQGHTTIFINPKAASSLRDFAVGVGGHVVSLRDLEAEGWGALDPFRYATDPQIASEIFVGHILSCLVEFNEQERVELVAGVQQGADAGARCGVEALQYVADRSIVDRIMKLAEGSTLFRLGVGNQPVGDLGIGSRGGFTLIEFDRPLALPTSTQKMSDYDFDQRMAVATMRLVTRASLEILLASKGGCLLVDEAWVFLNSAEGAAALTQIGREGRSQAILPILMTQKIHDVLREGVDLESFISRVLVLKTRDRKEATAGLELVGLQPTQERLGFLTRAGAVRATEDSPGRGALGYLRDMDSKKCAVMIGPVPDYLHRLMSTNKLDVASRDQERQQQAAQHPQAG